MLKGALVKVDTSQHWKSAIAGMKVKCIHCLRHALGRVNNTLMLCWLLCAVPIAVRLEACHRNCSIIGVSE